VRNPQNRPWGIRNTSLPPPCEGGFRQSWTGKARTLLLHGCSDQEHVGVAVPERSRVCHALLLLDLRTIRLPEAILSGNPEQMVCPEPCRS
jgi:hypothetical protein